MRPENRHRHPPTEPVGSLPRPAKLQTPYADYDAGEISKEDLEKLQDAAAKDSIERRRDFYAADTLKKSLPSATKPVEQAVIAPSMLACCTRSRTPSPATRARTSRRTSSRSASATSAGLRGRCRARLDRLHREPPGHSRGPAQPMDRVRACCRTSSTSPDYARAIAFQKIANRVDGTRRAAEVLGVG